MDAEASVFMIRGIGTDAVDPAEIRRLMEANPSFREGVFDASERAYCAAMADPWPCYAARFAAKEAVMKALGTGWSQGVDFLDIVVGHEPSGAPSLRLSGEAALRAGGDRVLLSLSRTGGLAVAFVVIETEGPGAPGTPAAPRSLL